MVTRHGGYDGKEALNGKVETMSILWANGSCNGIEIIH